SVTSASFISLSTSSRTYSSPRTNSSSVSSSVTSALASEVTFASSETPGFALIPSLKVVGMTVDSSRTPGETPVSSLEPSLSD
nr:hypothetical protein [Tanacetum cinerariifolium]